MNHFKDFSFSEWQDVWENNLGNSAMALWKLPQTDQVNFIIDHQGGSELDHKNIEQLRPGFVIADFEGKLIYLNAKDYYSDRIPKIFFEGGKFDIEEDINEKNRYLKLVEETVEEISKGKMQKVVLSRRRKASLEKVPIMEIFKRLGNLYPDAFISAFTLPGEESIWVGSSPEILVQQNKEGVFRTFSLAGTQVALPGVQVGQVLWGQKEIEEQAYVSRYIIDCFKKIRLREYAEIGPKTVLAGNLWHLKTEYRVNTELLNYKQLASTMLDLLHPTSAVCGTPKNLAKEWILKKEGYDRKYYTGYLGPINFDLEISIFVNLRTVELYGRGDHWEGYFYAGGGITENSNPQKEWEETELKIQTMLRGF
ncbi:MAG: Isochorismate synthase [Bacteroidota bacterium]